MFTPDTVVGVHPPLFIQNTFRKLSIMPRLLPLHRLVQAERQSDMTCIVKGSVGSIFLSNILQWQGPKMPLGLAQDPSSFSGAQT